MSPPVRLLKTVRLLETLEYDEYILIVLPTFLMICLADVCWMNIIKFPNQSVDKEMLEILTIKAKTSFVVFATRVKTI